MLLQESAQSEVIRKNDLPKSPCFRQSEYPDVRWLDSRKVGFLEDRFKPGIVEGLRTNLDTCSLEAGDVDPAL